MEFAANVQKLQDDVRRKVGVVRKHNTEAATKQYLVLPFIQTMGYAPFDLDDMVPEFTTDIGTKKGEKVDYALMHDGSPSILIECKKVGSTFGQAELSQLMRYFTVTDARFGILTDGLVYQFYSDLEEQNLMDDRPFFTFKMLDFMDQDVKTLKTFTKDEFEIDKALHAARRTKFLTSIKQVLQEELSEPTEEFLAFMRGRVYEGRQTPRIRSELDPLIRQVCKRYIEEEVQVRIKAGPTDRKDIETETKDESSTESEPPHVIKESGDSDEEFIQQELDAVEKVRTILGSIIDRNRLVPQKHLPHDARLGVAITIDSNPRKSICHIVWSRGSQSYGIRMTRKSKKQEVGATVDGFEAFADSLRGKAARWV